MYMRNESETSCGVDWRGVGRDSVCLVLRTSSFLLGSVLPRFITIWFAMRFVCDSCISRVGGVRIAEWSQQKACEGSLGLRLSHHSIFISMKSIRRRGDEHDVRNEARRREWIAGLHIVEGMNCSALQCIAATKKVIAKRGWLGCVLEYSTVEGEVE